tara:strand:+ start:477 stop:815 length:339 start_codon:yes stop_codon:yes gene_type:complete
MNNMNNMKVTDNVELDFPARMADGRMFTDYRQNCLLNNNIAQGKGSWEYRDFLINNSEELMKKFNQQQELITKCNKCSDNTVLPVKTILNCTPEGCNPQMNVESGLGQGIKY